TDVVRLVRLVLFPFGCFLDDERAVVGHVGGDVALFSGCHVHEAQAAEGAVLFVVEERLGDEATGEVVQAERLHMWARFATWLGDRPLLIGLRGPCSFVLPVYSRMRRI